eukprot:CAMPEP_0114670898 /NCGR_PEP_ID=MMETSP0191-20121206/40211_1 /TAXON_ID=126664 /ORGANISM="Sorites sp." /LENGTH=116 /DNA_ID=CAMNT_0001929387 /DNA_START=181 /DNA_END=531 /DNA_ORIENTATION=+
METPTTSPTMELPNISPTLKPDVVSYADTVTNSGNNNCGPCKSASKTILVSVLVGIISLIIGLLIGFIGSSRIESSKIALQSQMTSEIKDINATGNTGETRKNSMEGNESRMITPQ